MSGIVIYSAALVLPITAPPTLDGAIAVKDGRILHVGSRDWVVTQLFVRKPGGGGLRRRGSTMVVDWEDVTGLSLPVVSAVTYNLPGSGADS